MNYKDFAQRIIQAVGGPDNVKMVAHCATRLRFNLIDTTKANNKMIESFEEVQGIIESGGQFQVIIGPEVASVFKEVEKITKVSEQDEKNKIVTKGKNKFFDKIMDYISGVITPLMMPLLGASLIKVILTFTTQYELLDASSGTYTVLFAASNAIFTFLPILVAVTAAKKLNCNPYIAACIGGALMEPSFAALADTTIHFLGIPVIVYNYSSTLVPSMVAIAMYAVAEHWIDKKVASNTLKMFLLPVIGLAVFFPLTAILFGPFGFYVGQAISSVYEALYGISPILTGAFVGGFFTLLVVFGLHWGLVPIVVNDLALYGASSLAGMYISGSIALWGMALGLAWAAKNKKQRAVYLTHFVTICFAGISEPFLYGCVLKSKKMILSLVGVGAIGGILFALNNNAGLAFTFTNIFTIFTLWVNDSFLFYVISVFIIVILGVLVAKFFVAKDIMIEEK